jgi:transcriptional regulator with XRE-family HTH domain
MWDLIAFYLRFLRNQRELSGESLGKIMGGSKASVSRIENGESRLDGTQAALIDKEWKTGGLFALLVWYASIGHDPQWFPQYMGLEQRARMIRIFEAGLIPGLLQTEEYARALLEVGSAANVEELLQERMTRQDMLTRPGAPFLSVLLSQNAVEWPVGSPEIMRTMLNRLLEVSESTQIVIRVIPRSWETGAYPGLDGSFQLTGAVRRGRRVAAGRPVQRRMKMTASIRIKAHLRQRTVGVIPTDCRKEDLPLLSLP